MPTATTGGYWEYKLVSVYCVRLACLRTLQLATAPEAPIKLRGNIWCCILKLQQTEPLRAPGDRVEERGLFELCR
jgi:hypothetical protein